jgi:cobalt transporter subunit CbtB
MSSQSQTIAREVAASSISKRAIAAAIGGMLGVFLLIGVGFAGPYLLHNAAHDTRHANVFPCH